MPIAPYCAFGADSRTEKAQVKHNLMNNYEFKTDGQSVYFRPNDRCEWRLLCVAIDHLSAMQVEKGLQQSTIDFSLTYQFQTDILIHKPAQ